MYAIVRSGGKQHRVAVGDVITVDRLAATPGDTVRLPAVLHVDGATVTTSASELAEVRVDAEIVAATKGPKIDILRYKNKTRYRRRQGHRALLTTLRIAQGRRREAERIAAANLRLNPHRALAWSGKLFPGG